MPDRSNPTTFSKAFPAWSAELACPVCYGQLRLQADQVSCSNCGQLYPIVDGIPILIPGAAAKP